MTGPTAQSRESRHLLRAVALSLAVALVASAVPALRASWEFAPFVLVALVVFWGWVGLGMTAGLFLLPGKLRPENSVHASAATFLTVLFCGGALWAGAHDLALAGVQRLVRFNGDLAAYYLVGLQVFYFVLALLVSASATLAGSALRFFWRRRRPT